MNPRKAILPIALAAALALPSPGFSGNISSNSEFKVGWVIAIALLATAVIVATSSNGGILGGKDGQEINPYTGRVTGAKLMDF